MVGWREGLGEFHGQGQGRGRAWEPAGDPLRTAWGGEEGPHSWDPKQPKPPPISSASASAVQPYKHPGRGRRVVLKQDEQQAALGDMSEPCGPGAGGVPGGPGEPRGGSATMTGDKGINSRHVG